METARRRRPRALFLSERAGSNPPAESRLRYRHLADPVREQFIRPGLARHRISDDTLVQMSGNRLRAATKKWLSFDRRSPQNLAREARLTFIGVERMPYGRVDTIGADQNRCLARDVGSRRRIAKRRHYPMPILLETQKPEAGPDILITDPVTYRPQQQHLQSTTMDRILRPAVIGRKPSRLFGDQLAKFIEEPESVQHQAALLLESLGRHEPPGDRR